MSFLDWVSLGLLSCWLIVLIIFICTGFRNQKKPYTLVQFISNIKKHRGIFSLNEIVIFFTCFAGIRQEDIGKRFLLALTRTIKLIPMNFEMSDEAGVLILESINR